MAVETISCKNSKSTSTFQTVAPFAWVAAVVSWKSLTTVSEVESGIAVIFILSESILITSWTEKLVVAATVISVVVEFIPPPSLIVVIDEDTFEVPPYALWTCNSPYKPSGSIAVPANEADIDSDISVFVEYLWEPSTFIYSTENPVSFTDLTFNTSPAANPETLWQLIVVVEFDIVTAPAITNPLAFLNGPICVELATINWPPTTLTDSFSNTVVDNVPLIFAFSNSAVPLPTDDILQPFNPLTKSAVSSVPLACNIRPCSSSA